MRWTVHLEGGPRRVNHAAVCIENIIYSFGGYCSTDEYSDWEPIPVYSLDTLTLRWKEVKYHSDLVPFQIYGHTTVAYGHKVFMWGGRNNAVECDTLCCFDTKTLVWSHPPVSGAVPFATDGHSACVINNKMYTFGGFGYINDQYSQEVHCLDLDTFKWTVINPTGTPPSHRDFHTAVAYGNRMYVFGGRGDINSPYNFEQELYCPQVYYLDVVKAQWVTLNPSGVWPEGRRSHSAWVYKDNMYIFGGYNGNTQMHFNDLYRYSFKDNHWVLLNPHGKPPCQRRRQACILHDDKVFLFGGTSPHPNFVRREGSIDNQRLIDNGDFHILELSPTLKSLAAEAVIEHDLNTSDLPRTLIVELRERTLNNNISRPMNAAG